MKLIGYELREIFNPKVLIFLALFHVIFYFLFLEFSFKYFPNGRPNGDVHQVTIQMLGQYGDHMGTEEFEDFKQQLTDLEQKADQLIKSDPYFKEYRVNSYEEYKQKSGEGILPFEVSSYVYNHKERNDLFYGIGARGRLIEQYESKNTAAIMDLNDAQLEKVEQYEKEGIFTSLFSDELMQNYTILLGFLQILVLVSSMFLLIPLYIRDRSNGVIYLQYSSKTGRKHFLIKWLTAILAVTVLYAIQLSAFFMFYSDEIKSVFYPISINSYFNSWLGPYWYDLSFMEFIFITMGLLYVLLLLFTTLTAMISSLARNYVIIIAALVPCVIWMLSPFFDIMLVRTARIVDPLLLQPILYVVLILMIGLFLLLRWRRERVGDIN
ncbi:hypothetical protein PUW24_23145 [Paenibacillus urinalis]|uniref:ABC transporter permease n=1 Tax=Paenibacillus urinalis TaxID=521520 RepID=A0AAX3MV73_9BACL|nr:MULTISPECIES: hypothetical protein [Paenibacillus]WDH80948.1 hypothetical protein PUW23_15545 [Paenibacillus urinalis]WDH97001.1 hypothetical protein PUW24_23145 [Paenibacillus urinalis]WDI00648.1 hypothetical protein PUW25_15300 [Paenibacillus urinalis]GAK39330.1 hypothetical protein TCA2_1818 [Paenibacillus sp. TCA20]